ncbi:MAG TPA: hypothetical protein VMR98_03860, partial [Candidatus Polarisedimenticolaceae bacterium]|nr:hypothetical protein [Candidatus Polarisedimenticolaceae bacterium]
AMPDQDEGQGFIRWLNGNVKAMWRSLKRPLGQLLLPLFALVLIVVATVAFMVGLQTLVGGEPLIPLGSTSQTTQSEHVIPDSESYVGGEYGAGEDPCDELSGGNVPRLPSMDVGETAYAVPWSISTDASGQAWIDRDTLAITGRCGTVHMRIEHTDKGYEVWPSCDKDYAPKEDLYLKTAGQVKIAELHDCE